MSDFITDAANHLHRAQDHLAQAEAHAGFIGHANPSAARDYADKHRAALALAEAHNTLARLALALDERGRS